MSQPEPPMELVQAAYDLGIHLLQKNNEFYPFGLVLGNDGKVTIVGVDMESEHPKSNDVIERYLGVFQSEYPTASAVALGRDIRLRDANNPSHADDAIALLVERPQGGCWEYYLRYERKSNAYTFGALQVQELPATIFADDPKVRKEHFQLP